MDRNPTPEALLKQIVDQLVSLPAGEAGKALWEEFFSSFTFKLVKRGTLLVSEGAVASDFYFVVQGLLRSFYRNSEGGEFVKEFTREGELTSSLASLLTSSPSNLAIEALEDSSLLVIPYSKLQNLYSRHSCWQELGRKAAESCYLKREIREFELLTLDAKSRYSKFARENPALAKRIPQHQIASYLGMNPVTLSRIVNGD